jgi:LPXTG-site transpeptidase (sortase) family protein
MTIAVLLILGLSTLAVGSYRYYRYLNPIRPSVEELASAIDAPDWDPPAETEAVSTPTPAATAQAQSTPAPAVRRRVPGWPRIRIPAIDVDAPISNKSMGADGVMQNPNGPEDVAWYDFSSRPGGGGNVVMAGHVDYHDYGAAVFARLRYLDPGDTIEIALQNGTRYAYRVTSVRTYNVSALPTSDIIGPTRGETLTLITCDGEWNSRAGGYNSRLVVRAQLTRSDPGY